MVARAQSEYVQGKCLENLLAASVEGEGWFIAAPGYPPYGNYVWHRDSMECVLALDGYAHSSGSKQPYEVTRKALLRYFLYIESMRSGVEKLASMDAKLSNPEFYDVSLHPRCRLTADGRDVQGTWHNIQYDSVARAVVALARHTELTHDFDLLECCRGGLEVAIRYLFDAIWDFDRERGDKPQNVLTVCANEWEEKEEYHLRNPLFSSIVGLLYAANRSYQEVHQQVLDVRGIDFRAFEKQTYSMLNDFFIRDGVLHMIKRYREQPRGICTTSLWLLTTYDVFPADGEIFNSVVDKLRNNVYLNAEVDQASAGTVGVRGLRRYELITGTEAVEDTHYIDEYWGGQAWVITTAQLATALAMKGEVEESSRLLEACLSLRDRDGRLPEQFDGTYHDRGQYERWKGMARTPTPAPWLSWSHAEVLRTFVTLQEQAAF